MPEDILKDIWPEWHIKSRLGKGSSGATFLAVHGAGESEEKSVIHIFDLPGWDYQGIEQLREKGLSDEMISERYRMEADVVLDLYKDAARANDRENVVRMEDFGMTRNADNPGWRAFVREEWLMPLGHYANTSSRSGRASWPQEEVVRLGCDICRAMEAYADLTSIVPYVKLENIFFDEDRSCFKLDGVNVSEKLFALKKEDGEEIFFGAPHSIAAPEYCIERKPRDMAMSIYSLGMILYRQANRMTIPFLEPDKFMKVPERNEAMKKLFGGEEKPAPCDACPELAEVILRACAYRPEDRFQSARAMREALERIPKEALAAPRAPEAATPPRGPEPQPGTKTQKYEINVPKKEGKGSTFQNNILKEPFSLSRRLGRLFKR